MTDSQTLEARTQFLAIIKEDNTHREPWLKASTKASYKGALYGFASDGTQGRWRDFLAGYESAIRARQTDTQAVSK